MDAHSPRILLVEDNPADVAMIQKGFEYCNCQPSFALVRDGQAAIDHLQQCLADEEALPLPDFIFLDLDLPRVDGYGVLEHIATHNELLSIAVIVISGHILTESKLGVYRWQVSKFFGRSGGGLWSACWFLL